MAKTKLDWLKEAKALGLAVTPKDKIADIKAAIAGISSKRPAASSQPEEKTVDSKAKTAGAATAEVPPTASTELPTPKTTKAGKRSSKAQEEAEAKEAKAARKQEQKADDEPAAVKRAPAPKTRTQLERRGRRYRDAYAKIDRNQSYELAEGLKLLVETAPAKFDSTVELHLRLAVDPKQADQNIRDVLSLPHGTGKTVRVAVFAPADQHEAAKSAGADFVGEQELLTKLDKNEIDFDVLISMPQVMSQLGKYAKLLGPKGLMPNPKSGTVTSNIAEAVTSAKGGRLEFRVDAQGIVHAGVGKVSFGAEKLAANVQAVVDAVKAAKPASVKSGYVISVYATSTMGPSVRLSL